MELIISNYSRQNKKDRHGWRVDFSIKNAIKKKVLTIYQNNIVEIYTNDSNNKKHHDTNVYTEAWRYSKKVITDSFLIPIEMRKDCVGKVTISTVTWISEGSYNKSLRKSKGNKLNKWGLLYGRDGHLRIPHGASKVHRKFEITWSNIGVINNKNFTNGKDLRAQY